MTSAINASLALLSLKTEKESDCMHTNFINYAQSQVKLPNNPGSDVKTASHARHCLIMCLYLSDKLIQKKDKLSNFS